ncbi:hypothetical protein KC19_VG233700 [Ceratodon purpureus]|uniref:Uncharacterized protein n=1 Tax=Ceratodon purpureus TaxID=3225 RepID=A0A8T0HTC5_CERPU|nr:hypothetical protein KC19_VG233700 [Ceratodon purpureus]
MSKLTFNIQRLTLKSSLKAAKPTYTNLTSLLASKTKPASNQIPKPAIISTANASLYLDQLQKERQTHYVVIQIDSKFLSASKIFLLKLIELNMGTHQKLPNLRIPNPIIRTPKMHSFTLEL